MPLSMNSRQPDTAPEFIKPRIGTQVVQTSVCVDVNDQRVRAVIISAIKQVERLVLLSQPGINNSDIVGSDLIILGRALETRHDYRRLV